MILLTGTLLSIIDKSKYKKDDIEIGTKARIQILVEEKRVNGNKVIVLHTISIPDFKIVLYKDKLLEDVTVEVGIISKQFSFYGV